MLGRLPDTRGNRLHLGLPVDRAALAEGFCAQCRQQGLIDRVDSDSAECGFTDEFTTAPGAAIGVDVDGSEA